MQTKTRNQYAWFLFISMWVGMACTLMRPAARTIVDVATEVCEMYVEDHHTELKGITPAEFCETKEHLDPFIKELLLAQRSAGHMAVSQP